MFFVLPPDFVRSVARTARFATSDGMISIPGYARSSTSKHRLKKLMELPRLTSSARTKSATLQEAVDAAVRQTDSPDAFCRGRTTAPLNSLSDSSHGKQGRCRQNLLGKRVDYSDAP